MRVVMKPNKPSREWVLLLGDLLSALEQIKECAAEIAAIKEGLKRLAGVRGSLRRTAQRMNAKAIAVCISANAFNEIIPAAIKRTKNAVEECQLISDVPDRWSITRRSTASNLLNAMIGLVRGEGADNSVVSEVIFKLSTSKKTGFDAAAMKRVFDLTKTDIRGVELIGRHGESFKRHVRGARRVRNDAA